MSDVLDRIAESLDRLESAAKAATPGPWSCDAKSGVNDLHFGHVGLPVLRGPNTYGPSLSDTRHMALNDPAAVLAVVAGLRAIVERSRHVLDSWDAMHGGDPVTAMWPDVNRRERSHANATLDLIAAMFDPPRETGPEA